MATFEPVKVTGDGGSVVLINDRWYHYSPQDIASLISAYQDDGYAYRGCSPRIGGMQTVYMVFTTDHAQRSKK